MPRTEQAPSSEPILSPAAARRIAWQAQGLTPGLTPGSTSLQDLVESTGFIRTLSGVDVYLALRARHPQLERSELDRAVAEGRFKIVPAVRGCMYLVPESQVPLALRLADALTRSRSRREFEKVGLEERELDTLAEVVVKALADNGPSTTAELRRQLPDGAIRSLGDVGKKVGISSTLPPALRLLEFAGRIERVPPDGQLDTERYLWKLASEPLDEVSEEDVHAGICRIFFRAAGFATRKQFAAWSGLNQSQAKAAIAANDLVEARVEGEKEPVFLSPGGRTESENEDRPALLPFEDNLIALHGGPAFFVDPAFHDIQVPVWGRGKGSTLGDVGHSTLRSIAWRGKLIGFWEFDPDAEKIVHTCFDRPEATVREQVEEVVADLTRFIVDQLGHGRSFSIDTDDNLRERAEQIRRMSF